MPIAVRQLNFVYNPKTPFEKHALKDVNLEVADGEFLCIVGHTGSGKSTFVQHLNALVQVQSGFVEVNGLDLTLKKKKLRREMLKQLRGQVGMVFQYPEYQLFASSVEADVAFGPQNMKLSKEEVDERVREAIKAVGLDFGEVAAKSPFELSGRRKAPRRACGSAGYASLRAGAGRAYGRSRPARKKGNSGFGGGSEKQLRKNHCYDFPRHERGLRIFHPRRRLCRRNGKIRSAA